MYLHLYSFFLQYLFSYFISFFFMILTNIAVSLLQECLIQSLEVIKIFSIVWCTFYCIFSWDNLVTVIAAVFISIKVQFDFFLNLHVCLALLAAWLIRLFVIWASTICVAIWNLEASRCFIPCLKNPIIINVTIIAVNLTRKLIVIAI